MKHKPDNYSMAFLKPEAIHHKLVYLAAVKAEQDKTKKK